MLPYLHLFGKDIPIYSIAVIVGFLFAFIYWLSQKKRFPDLNADSELIFIYCLIGTAVGAKLLYLLVELPNLIRAIQATTDLAALLGQYLSGGFVFYGGLLGCLFAAWLYCRAAHVSFDRVLQAFLPIFPLVHGFGRIGCLGVGCCYGKPAEACALAITFQNSPIAPNGIPLYPVQIIEALWEWLLFGLLVYLSKKNVPGTKMLGIYAVAYAAARFVLEFYRGDAYRGFFLGLSTSQIISILLFGIGLILLLKTRNGSKKSE